MDLSPFTTASEWAQLIKSGRVRSREVLELYLARIGEFNPTINAVVWLDTEEARSRADAADKAVADGAQLGPLHGVPMTVKEAFDISGAPSTWGSPSLRINIASLDADVVKKLTGAGAVIVGKTNVPEWLSDWQSFNDVYGTTNNPWDETRVPGGSSGGSAAAVSAGLIACEYGSDIAGSIRGPAHFCGIYGHKTTCGIVSQAGHSPPGITLEPDIAAVGPMARSAADLELLLRATVGPSGQAMNAWTLSLPECGKNKLAEFRVGIVEDDANFPIDAEVKDVLAELYDQIEQSGAAVTRNLNLGFDSTEVMNLFGQMRYAATASGQEDAAYQNNVAALKTTADGPLDFRKRYLLGTTMPHYVWHQINERREVLRQHWNAAFAEYDLVLCPAAMTVAFPHDHEGERADRKVWVNGNRLPGVDQTFWAGICGFFHLPATVAPVGLAPDGLPVGVQIVGQLYDDLTCIKFAELVGELSEEAFIPPRYVETQDTKTCEQIQTS